MTSILSTYHQITQAPADKKKNRLHFLLKNEGLKKGSGQRCLYFHKFDILHPPSNQTNAKVIFRRVTAFVQRKNWHTSQKCESDAWVLQHNTSSYLWLSIMSSHHETHETLIFLHWAALEHTCDEPIATQVERITGTQYRTTGQAKKEARWRDCAQRTVY